MLENRKAKGFTVVMVMLTGVGDGTGPNLDGQHPWLQDNPATPSPAYFAHVDEVVKAIFKVTPRLIGRVVHRRPSGAKPHAPALLVAESHAAVLWPF